MKRVYLLALLFPFAFACEEIGKDPETQEITCEITAPEDGTVLDLVNVREMVIKGDAKVNVGNITKVELKVGETVIEEVTTVPVDYTYEFTSDQALGDITISLSVEGDEGAVDAASVTVTLERNLYAEGKFTDTRDSKEYKTVTIGGQTWFAENLAWLPSVNKPETAKTCNGEMYYYVLNYDGEDVAAAKATDEYKAYGVLYNWYAACNEENATGLAYDSEKGTQGPCPAGWHVPSGKEWTVLFDYVASQLEGVKGNGEYYDGSWFGEESYWTYEDGLKNVWSALSGLEEWDESNDDGKNPDLANGPRNTFGFNVIPAGKCNHYEDYTTGSMFVLSKANTSFWTQHLTEHDDAVSTTFSNLDYAVNITARDKYGARQAWGYNVRCIKD